MKKVTSYAGMEFIILDDDEIDCEHPENRREPYHGNTVINPNGEFVVGYGSEPVMVRVSAAGWRCMSCGFIHKEPSC